MGKLIDADVLMEILGDLSVMLDSVDEAEVASMIMNAPEAVVRCKDCRWLKETGGHANCDGYLSCRRSGKSVDWEDYCSWGKRG